MSETSSVLRQVFFLDYCNRGRLPEVKHTIIEHSLNASGVTRYGADRCPSVPTPCCVKLKKKEAALELVEYLFCCAR